MRAEFARAMIALFDERPNVVFVTGDLGYMALEEVSARYGDRFINAGVSEQNIVSVAAGLAHEGFIPWVYSIAPFTVLRPYEQIRNDVCLHRLPVKLIGNGGGYGYGIMGATHHVLEDIGAMRVLPHMNVYVPLVASDVAEAVRAMADDPHPNYLRLNLPAALPDLLEPFGQWRRVKEGTDCIVIGTGPVIANVLELPDAGLLRALEVWSIGMFPVETVPERLLGRITRTKKLLTIEEHYGQGGLGEAIAPLLLQSLDSPITFKRAYARGYPSGTYGSQRWHQEENGLAGDRLLSLLKEIVHA